MSIAALLWAREQHGLGATNKAVLKELAFRLDDATGRCDPSASQLARDLDVHVDSVRRALRFLEKRGIVSVKHRRDPVTRVSLSSLYTVHFKAVKMPPPHIAEVGTVPTSAHDGALHIAELCTVRDNRLNTNTNTNTPRARAVIYKPKSNGEPLLAKAARLGKIFAAELGIGPGIVLQAIQDACGKELERGQAEQSILASLRDAQRRRELIQHSLADAMDDKDFWRGGWKQIALLEQAAAKQPARSARHNAKMRLAAKHTRSEATVGVWSGESPPTSFPGDAKAQAIQDRVDAWSRGEITKEQAPSMSEIDYLNEIKRGKNANKASN